MAASVASTSGVTGGWLSDTSRLRVACDAREARGAKLERAQSGVAHERGAQQRGAAHAQLNGHDVQHLQRWWAGVEGWGLHFWPSATNTGRSGDCLALLRYVRQLVAQTSRDERNDLTRL